MNDTGQNDTVKVEIDDELRSIVPEFLEKRRSDCALILQHLQAGEFTEIRTLGHRMKGAGGSYGFDEISELGEIIENASLVADIEPIRTAVQRLESYLDRVEVVYV